MNRGRGPSSTPAPVPGDRAPRPGQSLVRRGIITDHEYATALERSERSGRSLWASLRGLSLILPRPARLQVEADTPGAPAEGEGSSPDLAGAFAALDRPDAIPALVSGLFEEAVRSGATDIHFDPTPAGVKVRARIDGLLNDIGLLPDEVARQARSRIKVLAGMDLLEKREPQDGHISLRTEGGHRDFRVATLLTGLGERLVVRFHQEADRGRTLDALGLEGDQVAAVGRLLGAPQGLILLAGPIGSGKTTTLYACLRALGAPTRNLMTIEDPIEYHLDGVNQVEVRPNLGLSFARGLRAILRQDPDVVMVGEIRDRTTARIAARAAASGVLVLSSVHAADGPGVLRSLANYRIPPHRITEGLVGVIVQRLVRTLCGACKRPMDPDPSSSATLAAWGLGDEEITRATLSQPTGCPRCFGTGFRGRTGIFEVIEADGAAWERGNRGRGMARWPWIVTAGPAGDLLRAAAGKVALGVTSIEEVRRVLPAPRRGTSPTTDPASPIP